MAVSNTFLATVACIITQIGFGGYGIVLKMFAEAAHENAVIFSFFRDGCCFPVLLIAACVSERALKLPASTAELKVFALLGVTGMWGNQLFYILGLYYTSASIASCWQPAIPVFAAVIAIATRVEPFPPLNKARGWLKLLGILCAAAGAIFLTVSKTVPEVVDFGLSTHTAEHDCATWVSNMYPASGLLEGGAASSCRCTGSDSLSNVSFIRELCPKTCGTCTNDSGTRSAVIGNIFLLINCMCMASYIVLQRHFIFAPRGQLHTAWDAHPLFVTAHSYFFGALAMVATGIIGYVAKIEFLGFGNYQGGLYNHWSLPKESVIPLVYAVFISSALCYGLITYSNKQLSATVVTAFWPLQVPVAVFLASCTPAIFYSEAQRCDASYHLVTPPTHVYANNVSVPTFGMCKPLCETMNTHQYIGAALIALGLLCVTYSKRLEDAETADMKNNSLLYRSVNQPSVPIARISRLTPVS